jgi:hypothetical protein
MLDPGTYALTAHPAGRTQTTRRIVVVVGTHPREKLDCSSSTGSIFAGASPFAAGGSAGSSIAVVDTKTAPDARKDKKSSGVLPAITKKLRNLPQAIPKLKPPVLGDAGSPPTLLGLVALGLLALSGIAILVYVIRFIRRPDTRSA